MNTNKEVLMAVSYELRDYAESLWQMAMRASDKKRADYLVSEYHRLHDLKKKIVVMAEIL